MPVKGQRRRILHTKKIKNFQKIGKKNLWPGTVIRFRYGSEGRFDVRPLILCLYVDRGKQIINGINLNYLTEFKVQRLFTFINKTIRIDQNNKDITTSVSE